MAIANVLWIDDDAAGAAVLTGVVSSAGIRVESALNAASGLALASAREHDLILVDLNLPDATGLELLEAMGRLQLPTPRILVTGFASVRSAVEAIRLGAADVIEKPFLADDLISLCRRYQVMRGPVSEVPDPASMAGRCRLLREEMMKEPSRSLSETARRAGLSAKSARHALRASVGLTWQAWRARILMQQAARALALSEAPLKILAEQFGYGSIQAFSRTFRRVMKSSPGQYRSRTRRSRTVAAEEE